MRQPIERAGAIGTPAYRSLSHRFVLHSNDPELACRADDLVSEFAHREPLHASEPHSSYELLRHSDRAGYSVRCGDDEAAASANPDEIIDYLLWRITNDTVELADGYMLIHAGAVVTEDGDGVLILGESGSGKTTLVAALVQDGFGYLSDEAGAIELATGLAHPWPRALGFTDGARSIARFADLLADEVDRSPYKLHVSVGRIRPAAVAAPCRIRHVIDHRYGEAAVPRVQSLSRAVAVAKLGSAAPRLRHEGDRGLEALADLMRGSSAHSLEGGDLERTVGVVRELVGQPGCGP